MVAMITCMVAMINLYGCYDRLHGCYDHLHGCYDHLHGCYDHLHGCYDHLHGGLLCVSKHHRCHERFGFRMMGKSLLTREVVGGTCRETRELQSNLWTRS